MLMRDDRFKGERGVAAVEFAIVGSLLFLILFGIVQFGIALNRSQGLQAAAREGARLGALPGTTVATIGDRVRESVSIVSGASLSPTCPANPSSMALDEGCIRLQRRSPGGSLTPVNGSATKPCDEQSGATIVVSVFYRSQIAVPLWKSQNLTLSGEGEFACEA
ncbi:MAG TPA: TadE family protein [Actinomycetota bacterium]